MAEHIWSLVCRKGVIDQRNNQLSALDIVEQISINPLPEDFDTSETATIAGSPTSVITSWIREDIDAAETDQFRLVIYPPKGKPIYDQTYDIDLTGSLRMRGTVFFENMLFKGAGKYRYTVQHKNKNSAKSRWKVVADIPIFIHFNASPEAKPSESET